MKSSVILFLVLLITTASTGQSNVTVDLTKENQTIAGFGAFGAMKPYWETPPFYTAPFIDNFLNDMGATIVRTNIFWDLEPVNDNTLPGDTDLSKFKYTSGSNLALQLPYYKALKDAGLKKIIATAWTPPEWMKLMDDPARIPKECYNCNNCPSSDPRRKVCGGRLNPAYYHEYAEYLVTYVKILKQEIDLDLYAINIQNEPYFPNPFEANVMLPAEFADVLRIVGQRFRQEGLSTKLFGPEHMAEWSWGVQANYVNEILGDPMVKSFLDIYAVHGYVDGVAPDLGSAEGWTSLNTNITKAHGKPLWMTETSGYPQTPEGAMNLAKSMYLALRFGNISAWVYWSVSGSPGSEQSLMANGEPTILHYISKQFFKYIRPEAIRVDATSENSAVLPLAFKNPTNGAMTLILINSSTSSVDVMPQLPISPAQFSVSRTSASENSIDAGTYSTGTLTLPAQSVTTLLGYGASGPSMDEIADYYVTAGEDATLNIPLTGIDNGTGGVVTIDVQSSEPSIVPVPSINYSSPSSTGMLTIVPNTSAPGKSVITVKLSNQNAVSSSTFGFNSSERKFVVEVVDAITSLKKSEAEELKVYPNPTTRGLVVEFQSSPIERLMEINNNQGLTVYTGKILPGQRYLEVETSRWEKGFYVLKLGGGKERVTRKIVIQ
jgi:glucuronoarabinoxylan endo-1,4-beta-xylanase